MKKVACEDHQFKKLEVGEMKPINETKMMMKMKNGMKLHSNRKFDHFISYMSFVPWQHSTVKSIKECGQ